MPTLLNPFWLAPAGFSQVYPYQVGYATGDLSGTGGSISTASLTDQIVDEDGISEGDLVIVFISTAELSTTQTHSVDTAGFERLWQSVGGGSWDNRFSVWWKIMGATPDSSIAISGMTDATRPTGAIVQVWRNVNPNVPFDVEHTRNGPNSVANANPAPIYINSENTTRVAACGISDGGVASVVTGTTLLSGDSDSISFEALHPANGDTGLIVSWLNQPTHQSENDPPAWSGMTGDSSNAIALLIRPQASGPSGTPAGWTQVGETHAATTNTTSVTTTLPGSLLEGDIVIACFTSDNITWPSGGHINASGYQDIYGENRSGSLGSSATQIAFKVMGATPDTDIDWKSGSGTLNTLLTLQVWRGVDTSRILDAVGPFQSGSSVEFLTGGPLTTQTNGALVFNYTQVNELDFSSTTNFNPNGAAPNATPTNWDDHYNADGTGLASSNSAQFIAWRQVATGGTTISANDDFGPPDGNASRNWERITFALTNKVT